MGYLRRNLPVGDPQFGKLVPCRCTLQRRAERRARELRDASGVSEELYARFTFETFDPTLAIAPRCDMQEIKRACEQFAANPNGWLVMAGKYGTGKTHLAYAIAGELLKQGTPVYAASVPEMLGMIQAGINRPDNDIDDRMRALRQVDVLILDDWGVEKITEWAYQCLFTVLNSRYNERAATVVTTNMLPDEWVKRDGRLASRLGDRQLSRVLVFASGDYRQGNRK